MSDIQKVLPTDSFKDMVTKVNTVIDGHNSLLKNVTDLYNDLYEMIPPSKTEVTTDEMNDYLDSLYS